MKSFLDGLSEEDRAEMEAFRKEMEEAVASGSFDAAAMAEEAPEAFQTWAEENGIDLSDMLGDMASRMEENGGAPPPPPPPGLYGANGQEIAGTTTDDEDDLISTLMDDLYESQDNVIGNLLGTSES
jgi:hypothetical protein